MEKSDSDKAKEKKELDQNLDIVLKQINKEYGQGAVIRLGEEAKLDIPTISTGALSLDIALGIGGLPRARIVEIYGPESSGKTTICLHVIANAQREGGTCAFIDTEHALDPKYAGIIGVDTSNLLVSQPDCGEDALNIAETLIRSNTLDVLVIDSVAALVPKAEIEGQMGDYHLGVQARLMSQALRKLTAIVASGKTCFIFTNQIREKIGVVFGNPETTTGGNALKFYSSIRLDVRRKKRIKDSSGEVIGNQVLAKVVKNKLAAPFKEAEFDIVYAEGISTSGSIIDVGCKLQLIEKRGSWLSFKGEHIGQGREQAKKAISDNPELAGKILAEIKENL